MRLLASQNGFVHVCGHRGHSIAAPENTLAALRAAKAAGATSCEIDLVLTRDDEIILAHDLLLDRITDGHGPIAAQTAADLATLDAGTWFAPEFAGERLPTLRAVLAYAQPAGLGLVAEIKERQRIDRLLERLADLLEETGALDDVILISFDHVDLKRAKEVIPGIRTEGNTHARHADPVGVARAANLDSLSIELDRFDPDDARALHAAGIALRCHIPPPDRLAHDRQYGIDPLPDLGSWLAAGLIDTLSGDDVAFLADLAARSPLR
jgi:glycerophosphoryl diester phosphodiesterase